MYINKIIPFVLIFACVYGCSKSPDTENIVFESYPGAIDSISQFVLGNDSALYTQRETRAIFRYDRQRRVRKIEWPLDAHVQQTLYFYEGNSQLPYLSVDTSYYLQDPNGYSKTLIKHRYTYDNQKRILLDSVGTYTLNTTFNGTPIDDIYLSHGTTFVNEYGSNYVTTKDKSFPQIYDYGVDTFFYNNSWDIYLRKPKMQNGYFNQTVNEFYLKENPLAQLNIRPMYLSEGRINGLFDIPISPLRFQMLQPKFLFKKISGRDEVFHLNSKHDIRECNMYFETDLSGRIEYLVIILYTHEYNYNGIYVRTSRWLRNYQFHYHQ